MTLNWHATCIPQTTNAKNCHSQTTNEKRQMQTHKRWTTNANAQTMNHKCKRTNDKCKRTNDERQTMSTLVKRERDVFSTPHKQDCTAKKFKKYLQKVWWSPSVLKQPFSFLFRMLVLFLFCYFYPPQHTLFCFCFFLKKKIKKHWLSIKSCI